MTAGVPRVARIIARLNIGGPAIQAAGLSRLDGFETLLIYGRLAAGEGDMSYLLTPEVTRQVVPSLGRSLSPLRDGRAFWRIYRALCRFRPDVVHTHTAKAGALGRLAAILYNATAGRDRQAVIVHTFHGHVFEGYFSPFMTAVFVRIERWLARRSDALVAISPLIRRDLLETYRIARDEQTFVIPLGFDLSPFVTIDAEARQSARAALGVAPDRFVVSTVGRLTEIKRHDLFLDMARQVAARVPAVEFLIVGDGELRRDLESQAAALGIGEQVRFLGWRTDLRTIYGATDVFVLTSRNEGTPVALIEALASGVPGVSTDVGGVRDVVADGETGLVVPFGSPEALAASVAELLASPERRRDMGARGREAVLSKFRFQRLADDVASLYGERLRARRGVKFGVI